MKVRKILQKQGSIKDCGVSPIRTTVEWGVMEASNKGSKSLCKHPLSEKGLRKCLDIQPERRRKYKGKVWKWKMEKRNGKVVVENNIRKIMIRNGKCISAAEFRQSQSRKREWNMVQQSRSHAKRMKIMIGMVD